MRLPLRGPVDLTASRPPGWLPGPVRVELTTPQVMTFCDAVTSAGWRGLPKVWQLSIGPLALDGPGATALAHCGLQVREVELTGPEPGADVLRALVSWPGLRRVHLAGATSAREAAGRGRIAREAAPLVVSDIRRLPAADPQTLTAWVRNLLASEGHTSGVAGGSGSVEQAQLLLDAGQVGAAVRAVEPLVSRGDYRGWDLMARVAMVRKEHAMALACLARAVACGADPTWAHGRAAWVADDAGLLAQAVELVTAELRVRPQAMAGLTLYGHLLAIIGQREAADAVAMQLAQLDEGAAALRVRAHAWDTAEAYETVLAHEPASVWARNRLAARHRRWWRLRWLTLKHDALALDHGDAVGRGQFGTLTSRHLKALAWLAAVATFVPLGLGWFPFTWGWPVGAVLLLAGAVGVAVYAAAWYALPGRVRRTTSRLRHGPVRAVGVPVAVVLVLAVVSFAFGWTVEEQSDCAGPRSASPRCRPPPRIPSFSPFPMPSFPAPSFSLPGFPSPVRLVAHPGSAERPEAPSRRTGEHPASSPKPARHQPCVGHARDALSTRGGPHE